MSTILEMRDVRLKRRELYRKMEGMALTQREFTPEETAAFEALRQQVEALDERLMALEDQQVAVEEGASRSSRRLTGPHSISCCSSGAWMTSWQTRSFTSSCAISPSIRQPTWYRASSMPGIVPAAVPVHRPGVIFLLCFVCHCLS